MAGRAPRTESIRASGGGRAHRILIIEGRFYEAISDELIAGAVAELEASGATYDRVTVPGALEIPQVIAQAVSAGLIPDNAASARYSGVVALGCVIRGDTPHFDYVAGEAARGIQQVVLTTGVPTIFGVITADNLEQAIERAGSKQGNTGEKAMLAALEMVNLFKKV